MTEAEIYEFDLNGYIVYRDLIPPVDLARMNQVLDDNIPSDTPSHFGFLDWDPMFMDLLAHPRTLGIMRAIIGDWLRLDHTYAIRMKPLDPVMYSHIMRSVGTQPLSIRRSSVDESST